MIVYTRKHCIPFLIDNEDWEIVQRYSWHISAYGYPSTRVRYPDKKQVVCLHIFLLGKAQEGFEWDHEDRNSLNNQRGNLRQITHSMNIRNSRMRSDNTSGVTGVSRHGTHWSANIKVGNSPMWHLGYFKTFEEAVEARRKAELEFFGGYSQ